MNDRRTLKSLVIEFIERKQKSLRSFGIYLGANVSVKVIPFIFLPFITAALGTVEFGIWSLFLMLSTLLAPLLLMGCQHHINRNFYKLTKDELGQDIFNMLLQSVVIVLILFAIGGVLLLGFEEIVSIPVIYLLALPLTAFATAILRLFQSIAIYEKKPVLSAAYDVSRPVLFYALAMALIFQSGMTSWTSMLIGFGFSFLALASAAFLYLLKGRWVNAQFSWLKQKSLLILNAPLALDALLLVLLVSTDRIMIELMLGIEYVGVYSVGFVYAAIATAIYSAMSRVWSPWANEMLTLKTPESLQKFVKYTYIAGGFLMLGCMIVVVSGFYYIEWFFTADFLSAQMVIPWIVAGIFFAVMTQVCLHCLNQVEKTAFFPKITLVSVFINILLNYVLINLNGIEGAAQATLFTKILVACFTAYIMSKFIKIPWFFKQTA